MNKRIKISTFFMFVLIIIIALMFVYIMKCDKISKEQEKQIQEQNEIIEGKESEIKELENQIIELSNLIQEKEDEISELKNSYIVEENDNEDTSNNELNYDIKKSTSELLKEQEILAFNSMFSAYEGRQSGLSTKSFINLIISINNDYDDRSISVEFEGEAYEDDEIENIVELIDKSQKYKISFTYGNSGYIEKVTIDLE